jgi:hypothetical protein
MKRTRTLLSNMSITVLKYCWSAVGPGDPSPPDGLKSSESRKPPPYINCLNKYCKSKSDVVNTGVRKHGKPGIGRRSDWSQATVPADFSPRTSYHHEPPELQFQSTCLRRRQRTGGTHHANSVRVSTDHCLDECTFRTIRQVSLPASLLTSHAARNWTTSGLQSAAIACPTPTGSLSPQRSTTHRHTTLDSTLASWQH